MKEIDLNTLFSKTFLEELCSIELKEPRYETKDNEEIIGEMVEVERRVFALSMKYGRMSRLILTRAEFDADNENERTKLCSYANDAANQSKGLKDLMWLLIRERLEVVAGNVGIRKGFQIVSFEHDCKDCNPLEDIVKRFYRVMPCRVQGPHERGWSYALSVLTKGTRRILGFYGEVR